MKSIYIVKEILFIPFLYKFILFWLLSKNSHVDISTFLIYYIILCNIYSDEKLFFAEANLLLNSIHIQYMDAIYIYKK